MMIIERRMPEPVWPREFTCLNCQSILEVEASDITLPGQRDAQGWFLCPVCTRTTTLSPVDTTSVIQWNKIRAIEHAEVLEPEHGQRGPE